MGLSGMPLFDGLPPVVEADITWSTPRAPSRRVAPLTLLHNNTTPDHQALNDLRRGGGTGAKIEHILPHLDSGISITGGGGGSVANSRAGSPELHGGKHPPRLSHDTNASAAAGTAAAPSQAALPEPVPASTPSPPELGAAAATAATAAAAASTGGAMLSIANPGLVASSTAAPMSASKMGGGGGVQSFRGRGGAFGMLLHKVQTTQTSSLPVPVPLPSPLSGAGSAGGAGAGAETEGTDGGAGGDESG